MVNLRETLRYKNHRRTDLWRVSSRKKNTKGDPDLTPTTQSITINGTGNIGKDTTIVIP